MLSLRWTCCAAPEGGPTAGGVTLPPILLPLLVAYLEAGPWQNKSGHFPETFWAGEVQRPVLERTCLALRPWGAAGKNVLQSRCLR